MLLFILKSLLLIQVSILNIDLSHCCFLCLSVFLTILLFIFDDCIFFFSTSSTTIPLQYNAIQYNHSYPYHTIPLQCITIHVQTAPTTATTSSTTSTVGSSTPSMTPTPSTAITSEVTGFTINTPTGSIINTPTTTLQTVDRSG